MTTEQQKAFEKWFRSAIYNHDYDVRKCRTTGNYQEGRTSDMWIAWQASRQHIIDKLQSEEMVERVSAALFEYGNKDYCAMKAKAAKSEGVREMTLRELVYTISDVHSGNVTEAFEIAKALAKLGTIRIVEKANG